MGWTLNLDTQADILSSYRLEQLEMPDPDVIRTSGKTPPIISPSGNPSDTVAGSILMLTQQELLTAASYEGEDYTRVAVGSHPVKKPGAMLPKRQPSSRRDRVS